MTIYDKIISSDEYQLAEFLYHFANDTINMFGSFVMPNKDRILDFLKKEVPEVRSD